jgi:arylsulfatase A-like enzyme
LRDGVSLTPLFDGNIERRERPILFRHQGRAALVDNNYKLLTQDLSEGAFELYDLKNDPTETQNLVDQQPELAARLQDALQAWSRSVDAGAAGQDYAEGLLDVSESESRNWITLEEYAPFLEEWKNRPEYASRLD